MHLARGVRDGDRVYTQKKVFQFLVNKFNRHNAPAVLKKLAAVQKDQLGPVTRLAVYLDTTWPLRPFVQSSSISPSQTVILRYLVVDFFQIMRSLEECVETFLIFLLSLRSYALTLRCERIKVFPNLKPIVVEWQESTVHCLLTHHTSVLQPVYKSRWLSRKSIRNSTPSVHGSSLANFHNFSHFWTLYRLIQHPC